MEYELKLFFFSFKIKTVKLVNGGAHENHSLVVNPSSFQQLHLSVPLYLPLTQVNGNQFLCTFKASLAAWVCGVGGDTHFISPPLGL